MIDPFAAMVRTQKMIDLLDIRHGICFYVVQEIMRSAVENPVFQPINATRDLHPT
ncbi:MAG: hypothetical protein NTV93_00545 [Verrucomicrobia bacterium]|nr:hypothetical protein [Verrucomicrobiota bacterium]